ncbi:MAG: signal recognition particle-docking protein FtsY, partial [Leptothrix ochracea]
MFSFFRKKTPPAATPPATPPAIPTPPTTASLPTPVSEVQRAPAPEPAARSSWLTRLKAGLKKTGSSIAQVFVGTRIDDALYEELETALLLADAGVGA